MRKTLAVAVALLMVLSMLLSSCGLSKTQIETNPSADTEDTAPTDTSADDLENDTSDTQDTQDGSGNPTEKPTDATNPTKATTSYTTPEGYRIPADLTYTHKFMETTTYFKLKTLYEGGTEPSTAYSTEVAPFVLQALERFENSTIKSIYIPVHKTKSADSNGDFVFTLSVMGNTPNYIASAIPKEYQIKINASEYGLAENSDNIKKFIKVDLSSYNIKVGNGKTIAFSHPDDTLIPSYLTEYSSEIMKKVMSDVPELIGFANKAGNNSSFKSSYFGATKNALLYQIEYERKYSSEKDYINNVYADEEFEKMLKAVKAEYQGKYLSVFGDSISTNGDEGNTSWGTSNNPAYNSTLSENKSYYDPQRYQNLKILNSSKLYWGQILSNVGMELCVNNAYAGGAMTNRYGNAYNRAQNLHQNVNGTKNPDVILVYYGINDTHKSVQADPGELYNLLQNKGNKTAKQVVSEWIGPVIDKVKDGGFTNSKYQNDADARNNYNNGYWADAYAQMMYLMKTKYPNAKIVVMTLNPYGASGTANRTHPPKYNVCLRAIAEYYGFTIVEQGNVIDAGNAFMYMGDSGLLHPDAMGHQVIYEEIVRTLYAEIKEKQ